MMVEFSATLLQFEKQGEKTGWTYISIPGKVAGQLKPGIKKSFRVKGRLDAFAIKGVALIPMGGGDFILAFNAAMRKGTGKKKGARITVQLQADDKTYQVNKVFRECLADEPAAAAYFASLPISHQHYFSKWIEAAKTDTTKTKRMAMSVSALAKKMGYPEMIKAGKEDRQKLMGS